MGPSARLPVFILVALIVRANPATAQLTSDFQVHGIAALAADRLVGGGVGYAVRPPGRLRLGASVSAGDLAGDLGVRAEALVSFHLDPGRQKGVSPYAAAGIAGQFTDLNSRGYVVVTLGIEQKPGRKTGFFAEAGFGGGFRVVAGYRFRNSAGVNRR